MCTYVRTRVCTSLWRRDLEGTVVEVDRNVNERTERLLRRSNYVYQKMSGTLIRSVKYLPIPFYLKYYFHSTCQDPSTRCLHGSPDTNVGVRRPTRTGDRGLPTGRFRRDKSRDCRRPRPPVHVHSSGSTRPCPLVRSTDYDYRLSHLFITGSGYPVCLTYTGMFNQGIFVSSFSHLYSGVIVSDMFR